MGLVCACRLGAVCLQQLSIARLVHVVSRKRVCVLCGPLRILLGAAMWLVAAAVEGMVHVPLS